MEDHRVGHGLTLWPISMLSYLIMVKSNGTCGLYYKHITIVNDDTSVINKS
jgi:hypothetical protein